MTVENTNPIQHFTANGETTVFAISFAVEGKDNIKVTVNGSVVSVNDYSYDALTKAVVFNAAPEDGAEVVVERVTSLDRSINYQTYDNSFRPETLNYDLDRIWHVLQEDKITDAEILARIKDEIEWRRTHNTEWDLLAQAREQGLFNALKSYMDTIGAMSVPNLFDGITDNVVITEEGVSQRVTNRGLKQAQAELLEALNSLNGTVNVNLAEAKTYTDDEKARAVAEETRISNSLVAETNRATDAESVLQSQINAVGVGNKAYLTYAAMDADKANIPNNSKVTVTNDSTSSNNGDWQWNGSTFTKSIHDPLAQAKTYTDEKISENNPSLLGVVLTGLTEKTLGASEAKYKILFLSGTLSGDCTVNFPKQHGIWEVRHQSTGGDILLKTLDSVLTPIRISNGQLVTVLSDGTNLLVTNSHKVNANGGALTNATANTPSAATTLGVATVQFVSRVSHGATYISLTTDKVLSADETSYKSIIFTGALNSDTTVEFPVGTGQWIVSNGTTGGFKLLLKCTGQVSTPITLTDNSYYNISAAGSTIRFTETLKQTKTAAISLTGLSEKTLSVEEARNDVIFLGGTLTQPVTVNFPKQKGIWTVRHQGTAGFTINLKTLDSTNVSPIPITNGQIVTVVSDAINLHAVSIQNQTGEHRGSFKVRQTYNMNDIVEHGSGRYKVVAAVSTNATTPLNNLAYKRIGSKPINNKELSVKSTSITPLTDKIAPMWISRDGLTCWANSPFRKLMESKDYGETWYELFDVGHGAVGFVDQLDNGELIFIFTESSAALPLVRQLYMTKGYGTEAVTFESVLTTARKYNYFSGFWGYNNYKHIILLTEYGCKYKPDAPVDDPSWTNEVGGNSRYVYMSTDYGKTWKIIFDLNSKTDGIGVHMHSAVYDYVWNRIWVHFGDGAFGKNGMYYSDDMGDTWTWALETNSQGVNFTQSTCTVVLEDCILFGSDSAPNGVYRLDRSQGKTPIAGHYKLEVAFKIPDTSDTLLNSVCYKIVQAKFIPNMPYLFGFAPESNPSKGIIVGTFDGYNFFNVWQDDTARAVGNGIRQLIGVTPKNEIIAVLQDGSGTNKEVRIKV